MTRVEKDEEEKLIQDNPHLKRYLDKISEKVDRPVFYSKLPGDVKKEEYPNLIYLTKGVVFIHMYKTKDMEHVEYHAVAPELSETEIEKRDKIQEFVYERAHYYKSFIKTQDELRKAIKEVVDEITVIDERSGGKIGKSKGGKVKVTSVEKMNILYDIIKTIVGGGPLEPFMRDPFIEDIHIITGENVHLIHKVFGMVKTNIISLKR